VYSLSSHQERYNNIHFAIKLTCVECIISTEREVIHRRFLARIASYDSPPQRYFPTPAEIAEFHRLRQRADGDYRITTGQLFNGPKPQQQLNQGVEAVLGEEEGPVGGEQEGAVGIEETEEKEALQVLWEDLTIAEPALVPIPPAPQVAEPPWQGRSRGRGVLQERKIHLEDQVDKKIGAETGE
jgi:hypothetical protein